MDTIVYVRNAETGKISSQRNFISQTAFETEFISQLKILAVSGFNQMVTWDLEQLLPLYFSSIRAEFSNYVISSLVYSPEKKILGAYKRDINRVSQTNTFPVFWHIDSLKPIKTKYGDDFLNIMDIPTPYLSPDKNYALYKTRNSQYNLDIRIDDLKQKKTLFNYSGSINDFSFSPDSKHLLLCGPALYNQTNEKPYIKIFDIKKNKLIVNYLGDNLRLNLARFNPAANQIVTFTYPDLLAIRDTKGKITKTFKINFIHNIKYFPELKFPILACDDGTAKIFNTETGDYIALLISQDVKKWIIYTNDGYWDASSSGGELVTMSA